MSPDSASKHGESRRVVLAALVGNLVIAVVKFIAAFVTGSSAMLTEGGHSLIDTSNQLLLLYGMRRSRRPADAVHPFGYGRELYFWSFVVSLLIFSGGAGVSIYEGVAHLRAPEPLQRPLVNFVVLGLAFLFEGTSWWIAWRAFSRSRGRLGFWQALRASKDPSTFVALCEDSAALAGILIAGAAIGLALLTGDARWDGAGSVLIGCLLGGVAMILARETKGLLIGERASPRVTEEIERLALEMPGVCAVTDIRTVHLAPDQIVGIVSIEFDDDLRTGDIERKVRELEARTKQRFSEVTSLFIRPRARAIQADPVGGGRRPGTAASEKATGAA